MVRDLNLQPAAKRDIVFRSELCLKYDDHCHQCGHPYLFVFLLAMSSSLHGTHAPDVFFAYVCPTRRNPRIPQPQAIYYYYLIRSAQMFA